ncbi:hypothetical protein HK100_004406 [Physocladia obscura]|uniref:Uncharacterized protein n=1 Tax=Physocladia obscura TaxID=109957 RepID=A0AAD5T828_9FUNG|nr:hypothetical protein HK100_004406 [Physocladia obscura]
MNSGNTIGINDDSNTNRSNKIVETSTESFEARARKTAAARIVASPSLLHMHAMASDKVRYSLFYRPSYSSISTFYNSSYFASSQQHEHYWRCELLQQAPIFLTQLPAQTTRIVMPSLILRSQPEQLLLPQSL